MKDELVSIIVPVYNTENYIDICVKSIVNQTYSNIEIILVDDGSTDASAKLCDDWSIKDKRITVLHQKNSGVSAARNSGIEYASGKWIMFVDADDIIDHELMDDLVKTVIEMGVKTSLCGYRRFIDEEQLHFDLKIEKSNKLLISTDQIKNIRQGYFGWGILFDKEILDTNHLRFDPELKNLEDVYFLSIYSMFIENVGYIKKQSYYYRITAGSITSKCVDAKWQINSWNKLLTSFGEYLLDNHLNARQYQNVLAMRRHCINNLWAECLNANLGYKESIKLMKNFKRVPFQTSKRLSGMILYLAEFVHGRIPVLEFLLYSLVLRRK
ncbi:glycosyltransferase family 2 protein [Sellimonas caecigallum]|uniref:Glycosyltransferase family 2 protein n=1 Tax=Sellimonas caecigallum TaxID=2592333 RepID=A0ABS7L8A5_9FIRM|nr:glycosyltransferase family 2 protein [Sellimonas caecigallum]MBY0759336.1 glycosyltransferase family 2 protein [Sellimonas caecigallum]